MSADELPFNNCTLFFSTTNLINFVFQYATFSVLSGKVTDIDSFILRVTR